LPRESVTVKISPERPARTQTPIQFPAVLAELKASVAEVVVPASLLVCWTKAIAGACARAPNGTHTKKSKSVNKNPENFMV
jgi:hypothetical protein